LDDPGVKKRLTDLGGSIPVKADRTPARFSTFVQAEIARWSPILKAANVEAARPLGRGYSHHVRACARYWVLHKFCERGGLTDAHYCPLPENRTRML
jgi:hypothetical protein